MREQLARQGADFVLFDQLVLERHLVKDVLGFHIGSVMLRQFGRMEEEVVLPSCHFGQILQVVRNPIAHLMERPGFQFLGYVFYDKYRDPRQSSRDKLHASIREKSKLTNGHSLKDIISTLNASLRGWYNYFKFCSANGRVWAEVDQRVRFRLRAILDKRRKGGRSKRRGRGHAHQRWPNAYFTEHGLFSLVSAVKLVRQP